MVYRAHKAVSRTSFSSFRSLGFGTSTSDPGFDNPPRKGAVRLGSDRVGRRPHATVCMEIHAMGIEIYEYDGRAVMVCNGSGHAFGPVFDDGRVEAEAFIGWLASSYAPFYPSLIRDGERAKDPRELSEAGMSTAVAVFRASTICHACGDQWFAEAGVCPGCRRWTCDLCQAGSCEECGTKYICRDCALTDSNQWIFCPDCAPQALNDQYRYEPDFDSIRKADEAAAEDALTEKAAEKIA